MSAVDTRFDGTINSPELNVYGLSFCEHCKEAKEYLKKRGFSFRYLLVDKLPRKQIPAIKREIEPADGAAIMYPVLRIENDFLYGFNQYVWDQKLRQKAEIR
ncbi:glutaredoxin domain-containing protein [Marispirochaeta sp.]|jgi:glutaredoxin|uniref:glutaredoxin family protein n=1 Tax=Marispirochaeta sp. TaxID=2038653 RepID=UPI0029C6E116|nr:glutaredoxin domain-containing protein [Marispirochaeta sp.]